MTNTIKIVIILVAIIMLFNVAFTNASQAATSEFKNIAVNAETGKKVGEQVKVTISATADFSLEDGGLLLKYDTKKLKYVSSTVGMITDTTIMSNNKTEGVIFALSATGSEASKVKKGTVIGTVIFTILQGATGDQTLTLVDEQVDGQPIIATGKLTVATVSITANTTITTTMTVTKKTNITTPTKQTTTTTTTTRTNTTKNPTTTKDSTETKKTTSATTTPKTTSTTATKEPTTENRTMDTTTTEKSATNENETINTTNTNETAANTTVAEKTTTTNQKSSTQKIGVVSIVAVACIVILVSAFGLTHVAKRYKLIQ